MIWDDTAHVTSPALQSLHGLWRIWFELGATQQYYPLLHSAFWIEHRLWGNAVLGYHLANLGEHALAACLVVLIVRRLELPGAWLAGLIFALHPVCVEAVAWISEQKSTLSAVFYLASALTYLRFDQTRRRAHYLWALGLFILALLSKTVTATLPAALLVVFWWQRGRVEWRRDVRPLLPWFAISVPMGLFTAWVERTFIGAQGAFFALTPAQRFLLPGHVILFYASKLVWPSDLIFTYPRWNSDPTVWWQYLYPLGVLALVVGLWRLPRRGPLAGFLIFSGTLFPVLGFLNVFPFRFSYVADHFQYLASLGILVPIACTIALGMRRSSPWKAANLAFEVMLLAVLGVLTWRQSGIYSDPVTLYRVTLARNPESFVAHMNLGGLLSEMPDQLPETIAEYQAAVRILPDDARAHNNLGHALARVPGRLPDAIAEYQEAVRIQPRYVEAHNNLGIALAQTPGGLPEAITEFEAALRIQPNYVHAHMNLGNTWMQTGRLPEAIAEYQAALRIQPNNARVHEYLGVALAQTGRLPEAIAEYQAALRIQPAAAESHNNLGEALAQVPGRLTDAISEYQTALQIEPDYLEAHKNLGDALALVPERRQEAIAQYEAVLQARPDLLDVQQAIKRLRAAHR
jgi:tetratricopeptide (TPR) repeat protein